MSRQTLWKLFPTAAAALSGIALLWFASRLPGEIFLRGGVEGLAAAGPRFAGYAMAAFVLYGGFYVASWATISGRRWGQWLYWGAVAATFGTALAAGGISRLGAIEWFLFALAPFGAVAARADVGKRAHDAPAPAAAGGPAFAWHSWPVFGLVVGAGYLALAIAFSTLAHPATTAGAVLFALAAIAAATIVGRMTPLRVAAVGTLATGALLLLAACVAGFVAASLFAERRPLYESLWLLVAPGFLWELRNGMPLEVALVEFAGRALSGAAAMLLLAVPLQLRLRSVPDHAGSRDWPGVAIAGPGLPALVGLGLVAPLILMMTAPAPRPESALEPEPQQDVAAPPASVPPPPASAAAEPEPELEAGPPLEGLEEGGTEGGLIGVVVGGTAAGGVETLPESHASVCPLNAGCGGEPTVRMDMGELRGQATSMNPPVLPESLRAAGLDGMVMVELVVGIHGVVVAEETQVTGTPEFVVPVREAVEGWRFRPQRVDGRAARVTSVVPFRFVGGPP